MLIDVNVEMYPDVLKHFPGYDYRVCYTDGVPTPERVDYRRGDNVTGHQQRAFIMWWAIEAIKSGYVAIELGGAVHTPGAIDVDRYADDVNPPIGRSDGHNPAICLDGCNLSLLRSGKWGGHISNHVFEHLDDPYKAVREAFRLMRPGAHFCMIVPDSSIQTWNYPDDRHVSAFLPRAGCKLYPYDVSEVGDPRNVICLDEFALWMIMELGGYLEEITTLNNNFSLNLVVRKL